MAINLVKNVINGVNLVKVGNFWSKLGHFGGQNDVICQNLGKVIKSFFSLNDSKNYFSQVYGQKSAQKRH